MSAFNLVVKPHIFAPFLLRLINWAQPDDPNKTYPLLGRLSYVWTNEDYTIIKLMLRDGASSQSKNSEEVIKQIKNHESFISLKEWEGDKTFLIAEFKPILKTSYDRKMDIEQFLSDLKECDEELVSEGLVSITKDPGELFNEGIEEIKKGNISKEVKTFGEGLVNAIEQIKAEEEIQKTTKEAGIEGFTPTNTFTISPDGKVEPKD